MNSTIKYALMALALTSAALAQNTTSNPAYQAPDSSANNDIVVRIRLLPGVRQNNGQANHLQPAPTGKITTAVWQEPLPQQTPMQAPVSQQVPVQIEQQQSPALLSPPVIVVRDGTPVRLRLPRTLSSAQAKTGDQIDFDVLDDVIVGGQIIIPRTAKAIGIIAEAEHKKWAGRGGKLNLALQYVRLDDGTKVNLRAESDNRGGGHVGAMTAGMVATVALTSGIGAPLFLFIHGKEAVVPAGTEITAFVNGDARVNGVVQTNP